MCSLHVFNMEVGTMMCFDTQFAMQNVHHLQEEIREETGVAESDQILLVSGGVPLDPSQRVVKYNTGTSENPIFLILRTSTTKSSTSVSQAASQVDSSSQSCIGRSSRQLDEFRKSYRDLSSDSASLELVCGLTELSRRIFSASDSDTNFCRQLVSEQHLLQQGWFAVVANLEDTVKSLRGRGAKFRDVFQRYLKKRPAANELLRSIEIELELLDKIPLLPCLIPEETALQQSGSSNASDVRPPGSLLSWISSKDSHHNLNDVIRDVRMFVEQYDETLLVKLDDQFNGMSQTAEDPNRTAISGLHRRLAELDKLMAQISSWLNEQKGFSDHIRQFEGKLKAGQFDGDLLRNQWFPLKEIVAKMIRLYENLLGVSKKFVEAKGELLTTIRSRLTWVAGVQESIGRVDGRIVLLSEHLKRIRLQVELLRQIKEAPLLYGLAVAEVVRRNAFKTEYQEWAHLLSSKAKVLYDGEMTLRRGMQVKLDRHFLCGMFVGLRDLPPAYCVEPPAQFDCNLPAVQESDLQLLRSQCPELREKLKVYCTRVFDQMRIDNPKAAEAEASRLTREASFITTVPPRNIFSPTKLGVVGSHWWSGEENLAGTTPTSLDSTKKSYQMAPDRPFNWDRSESFAPTKVVIAGGSVGPSKSHRFGGESFDAQMGHSRQLSERSSRFGTPEEDIPMKTDSRRLPSDENMSGLVHVDLPLLESPPEIISQSQLFEGQEDEQLKQQDRFPNGNGRTVSAPKPITTAARAPQVNAVGAAAVSPTQTDVVSDLGGILLDGSSSDSKENSQIALTTKQRNDETIELLEKQVTQLLQELTMKNQSVQEGHETEAKLRKDVVAMMRSCQKFFAEFRVEMSDSRVGLLEMLQESAQSTGETSQRLVDWVSQLEQRLKADFETATGAILELKEADFNEQLARVEEELGSQKRMLADSQRQLELTNAYLKEREEVVELLQQQQKEADEAWAKRLESEKLELVKQLTIDNELDMEDLRKGFHVGIAEKDNEIVQLRTEIKERDAIIMHLRSEQDRLLSSMYDQESDAHRSLPESPVEGSSMTALDECERKVQKLTEDYEMKLKGLRTEIEASYRDKVSFLQSGMEEKHRKSLERSKLERDFDVKAQADRHQRELELMKAAHQTEMEGLRSQLDKADGPTVENSEESELPQKMDLPQSEDATSPTDGDGLEMVAQSVYVSPEEPVQEAADEGCLDPKADQSSAQKKPSDSEMKAEGCSFEGKVSVLKVRVNDFVLIVFNERYASYVVFTVVPILHFIDKSSYEPLGLLPTASVREAAESSSRKNWVVAKVVQVEYCVAKKDRNRYKVPRGTKFHLVKAVPYTVARKQPNSPPTDQQLKRESPLFMEDQLDTVFENAMMTSSRTSDAGTHEHHQLQPPSPIITRRTRTQSLSERAASGPTLEGVVKYFCRQRGHGFISPKAGGDDIFVHITDIDGEFVPHEGDEVTYKTCTVPPKFEKTQAVHVTIRNLAPGVKHERWDQPPSPHAHPHPMPNTPESRHPHPDVVGAAHKECGGSCPGH